LQGGATDVEMAVWKRKQVRHALLMTDGPALLTTPRLRLVPATSALITAELGGVNRLKEVLDTDLPPDWPPEHHDIDTLAFWRKAVRHRGASGWWLHYALLT
jgi:hypothetical protein